MSGSSINKVMVNHLDALSFAKKLSETKDAVLIDVRTEDEHFQARIPNSVLINMYKPGYLSHLDNLEKSKTYFIYCHSGGRSAVFCEQMINNGFEKVNNLENGIVSWHGELEQG